MTAGAWTGEMRLHVQEHQDFRQQRKLEEAKGIVPSGFQHTRPVLTHWPQASGLQNWEAMHYYTCQAPRLRYFVTAALGDEYSRRHRSGSLELTAQEGYGGPINKRVESGHSANGS